MFRLLETQTRALACRRPARKLQCNPVNNHAVEKIIEGLQIVLLNTLREFTQQCSDLIRVRIGCFGQDIDTGLRSKLLKRFASQFTPAGLCIV